jgi:pimeloyl-ACP methyl ester carboxylesterase
VEIRERSVSVRGLALRVRERGPADVPACFLLHGWLDHRASFDLLAPLLPGRTIAYDHRGHGDSAWAGAGAFYHFVDYLGDLEGLVRELAPARPVRLVGHSMGGALSLLYAAARPERVSHVTMLDAAPLLIPPDDVPPRLSGWLEDLWNPRAPRAVASIDDAQERLLRGNPQLAPEAARLLAEGGIGPDPSRPGALAWKWDPLLRARSPLPITQEVLQQIASRVRAPVLLLRAERGHLPEEDELRRRFSHLTAVTIETVGGTSHHLHLEKPRLVADRIARAWKEAGG